MITKVEGNCQYPECDKAATHIAHGRKHLGLGCFCEDHATEVANQDCPEYDVDCPNCGCLFGVN